MELEKKSDGDTTVQSVQRAVTLLRLVTQAPEGVRLTDLVRDSGMRKPTVHRLLKQLVASGLLMQRSGRRRYELGPVSFEVGIAASRTFPLREIARPFLEEVSERTGDSVVLVVRSEADSVCVDRKHGVHPLHTLEPGCRRPMGVGAGGLAILSFLDNDDQNRCLETIHRKLEIKPYGKLSIPVLHGFLTETRYRGWACISNFGALGIMGVGVPLFNQQEQAFGAIAIRASTMRMTQYRIAESAKLLQASAAQLETALSNVPSVGHQ